jgi:oligopeptide transport system substrate-binding protein
MGWLAEYPDPDHFLRVGVRSMLPHWRNDKYSQLLEEAQRTLDQGDRIRLYQEADKILIEDAVVMPIAYNKTHFLCKPWVKLRGGRTDLWFFKDVIIEPH